MRSLVNSCATTIAPLELLVAGPFSDWLGRWVWFWAGGLLCVMIALAAFFVQVIMNIEAGRAKTQTAAPEAVWQHPASQQSTRSHQKRGCCLFLISRPRGCCYRGKPGRSRFARSVCGNRGKRRHRGSRRSRPRRQCPGADRCTWQTSCQSNDSLHNPR
jgi:hypothetical protein